MLHPAVAVLRDQQREGVHHEGQVSRDDVLQRRRPAPIGDVHHVEVARAHPQQLDREVRRAADARAAVADPPRRLADACHQLGEAVHAQVIADGQRQR
jgi:hypothetical protein